MPARDRVSCHLFRTLHPEDPCATRPRTDDADRPTKLATFAAS
ncbi:hypothetical protein ACWD48_35195 [Streptomyces sp. NPDC002519]